MSDEKIDKMVAELRAAKKPGETIAKDDASSVSTAVGWEAHQKKHRNRRAPKVDVPRGKLWLVTMVGEIPPFQAFQSLSVEAERWFDARRAASTLLPGVLRVEEVHPGSVVSNFRELMMPRRRLQVRWVGQVPNLHLECRLLDPSPKAEEKGLREWHRV